MSVRSSCRGGCESGLPPARWLGKQRATACLGSSLLLGGGVAPSLVVPAVQCPCARYRGVVLHDSARGSLCACQTEILLLGACWLSVSDSSLVLAALEVRYPIPGECGTSALCLCRGGTGERSSAALRPRGTPGTRQTRGGPVLDNQREVQCVHIGEGRRLERSIPLGVTGRLFRGRLAPRRTGHPWRFPGHPSLGPFVPGLCSSWLPEGRWY
mmetsp:Transcript_35986/g.94139  ORF Transcript_35986/g.94139 Transcript_35986/m.94139 type:complete len:213 (-) Transcript_35986:83-721(-)